MSERKEVIFFICAILAYLIIFSILSREEVNHEIISPVPTATPTLSPTTTRLPEYEEVSWYGFEYCEAHNPDCKTFNGEPFDETALTCACNYSYPLGTLFRVSYRGRSVVVRCNDRGSFKKYGRALDLSKMAFEKLASTEAGTLRVQIEELKPEYEMLNRYRKEHELEPLQRNENLEMSARLSAQAIYTGEREWSHDGYRASISAHYDNPNWTLENLAHNFMNFSQVLDAWHFSKGHRENLQHTGVCEVGIGNYYDIWVLHGACK